MVRKHEQMRGEVRDKLERAALQLRKVSQHFAHVKGTVQRTMRHHEKQARNGKKFEMEYEALSKKYEEAQRTIESMRETKDQAMVFFSWSERSQAEQFHFCSFLLSRGKHNCGPSNKIYQKWKIRSGKWRSKRCMRSKLCSNQSAGPDSSC